MILVNLRWTQEAQERNEALKRINNPNIVVRDLPPTVSLMTYPHVTDEYIYDASSSTYWKIVRILHPINGGPPMVEVE